MARCRGKVEALRWQAESHRRLWEGVESPVEEILIDAEMLEWADKLVACFYWLDDQDASESADISLLDDVAGCYEAVAEAMVLLAGAGALGRDGAGAPAGGGVPVDAPSGPQAAPCARRPGPVGGLLASPRAGLPQPRLPQEAHESRRPRRPERVAGPGRPHRVAVRERRAVPQQKSRIERMRQHLQGIRDGNATEQDWQSVVDVVEEMVKDGVPPSNREVRDLLLPVVDDLPVPVVDDLPPGFRLVLRELDRFLATRAGPEGGGRLRHPRRGEGSGPVTGRTQRRPDRRCPPPRGPVRPRRALGLRELIWIETKEHQSIESFEPVIARPEVALILLAIRWSSHAFGDVRQYCVRHGKPLVRLPGGYGLHQVAAQILAQCSELLGGR